MQLAMGILGVFGVLIGAAAWYWPDFWKRTVNETRTPAGSEWRERPQKDSFTFAPFDAPDAANTHPTAINDNEEIAGIFNEANTGQRSFFRRPDGTFLVFDYPGSGSTNATGINYDGEIVGFYYDATSERYGPPAHGFLRYRDGSFISFDYPGSSYTFAHGINDKKEVVGVYHDIHGIPRGFIRHSDGTFSSLDYSGAVSTVPTGINNRSEIIGHVRDPKFGDRGFLRRSDGTFIAIAPDPTTFTYPKGINDSGDVVGYTGVGAFLRRKDGALIPFDHPACLGSSCAIPTGINNRLEVVGQFQKGSVRGFLAKPISEKR
jgi:uncharacterized membrane protein